MTSRELRAKLAEAMQVIELFETSIRYRDSLVRLLQPLWLRRDVRRG